MAPPPSGVRKLADQARGGPAWRGIAVAWLARVAKASVLHEAPLDIMRERPEVLLEVLALAKVDVVGGAEGLRVVVADSALTELPSQRNADFVAHVHEEGRARPRLTVIVEVQRSRRREKKYAWSEYVVRAARRHGAPVVLLVWVFDARTARWARGPHKLGPGFAYSPVVIGPEELPAVGSVEEAAAHLDLAVLVALTRLGEAAAKKTDPGRGAGRGASRGSRRRQALGRGSPR